MDEMPEVSQPLQILIDQWHLLLLEEYSYRFLRIHEYEIRHNRTHVQREYGVLTRKKREFLKKKNDSWRVLLPWFSFSLCAEMHNQSLRRLFYSYISQSIMEVSRGRCLSMNVFFSTIVVNIKRSCGEENNRFHVLENSDKMIISRRAIFLGNFTDIPFF
jgi:hypothetical protein